MKFTQTAIARVAAPPMKGGKASEKVYFDTEVPRLGLRVRTGGSRNYIVYYRLGGIQRRAKLGSAAVLTVDEARRKARKVLSAVDDGRDPAAELESRKAAAALTFSVVVDDYLKARQMDMKPRSLVECTRHLKKLWKPLHGLPLGAVTRPVVAGHIRKIAESSGPIAANRARATLSAMYGWAIGEGLCDANPVDGTNKAIEEKSRERVLTDAELQAIWKHTAEGEYGRIVRLLMLTGQRRDEVGSLCWSELTEDENGKASIVLPAARTKNGRQHEVPLSRLALDTLGKRGDGERDLVFGVGEGGYSGWSKAKAGLDQLCGVKDWTLHDLRRTVATRMADLGVQPHIIEAVLNHVSGHKSGVAGIYNRSTYSAEKRTALELWAAHIASVAAGKASNVVGLAAKKRA